MVDLNSAIDFFLPFL